MRKFTKEITALMASVAVSAAVGTTNVSSEEIIETEGVIAAPTEIVETAGVALPTDCTDPTLPPVDGEIMPPDDYTYPTEPIPPMAGDPTMPDEYIEPTTITEPTEEFPPCVGVPMLLDGDINGDGSFDVADVVTLQNYLSGKGEEGIDPYLADFCLDGEINVFDLVKMKRELIEQSTPELSENNYDYELIEKYDNLTEYKGGAQTSVYTQNDEALVMWKIPLLYEMDGCEVEITSIDSCTYKTDNSETIAIVKSDNVYYYDSTKGYSYCVIKSLKEGNATLTLDCKSGERDIEFTIDKNLNISLVDSTDIY